MHIPTVEIEEVTSVLTPAPGVTIEAMLQDAQLQGYERIEIHEDHVVVTWVRKKGG